MIKKFSQKIFWDQGQKVFSENIFAQVRLHWLSTPWQRLPKRLLRSRASSKKKKTRASGRPAHEALSHSGNQRLLCGTRAQATINPRAAQASTPHLLMVVTKKVNSRNWILAAREIQLPKHSPRPSWWRVLVPYRRLTAQGGVFLVSPLQATTCHSLIPPQDKSNVSFCVFSCSRDE